MIAARDGAPADKRTALPAHLAGCPSCRQLHAALAESSEALRDSANQVALPDAAEEWLEIRSRIRKPPPTAARRLNLFPILGVPLAAAAAFVIAFIAMPQWFGGQAGVSQSQSARAEFVEVPGSESTTVVFVDEPSGWLVVWAVSPSNEAGG